MRNKAIEKRVDSLLNQSPKALALMASQITDDILESVTVDDGEVDMAPVTEFMARHIKPLDARTYHKYRDEYSILREHYWMNMWLTAELRLAESRRDYLAMLKVALTCVRAGDTMREYIGVPASDTRERFDVEAALEGLTVEIDVAETTARAWREPETWQLIGYEPPVDL